MADQTAPVPPQNLDAEESVLGAAMLSATALDNCEQILRDGRDFYRESHTIIWRACTALHARGEPVDAITVADELDQDGKLDRVGGKERVHELASLVPATSNAGHYARIVVEMARLRDLITAGERLQRLGWDRPGDVPELLEQARAIAAAVTEPASDANPLTVEDWHTFEKQAHDRIPVLITDLWAEAAFGFIAAPPKKGKTWVALALAVSVATGKPFLSRFDVPTPRPVLYVALEGHRSGLRARIGAITRGAGADPDTADLNHLHFLYKPAGINLADAAWARAVQTAAETIEARLVVVDVLRAGAQIKENDASEFAALRHNLQPITDAGISLALLHHFGKLTDTQRDRAPGERMSGTGAMFGALDVAIYITGSEDHARRLRLEFDTRDLAHPDTISVELQGAGTGPNGGYTYRDAATFIETTDVDEDDFKKAPPQEIYDYIVQEGGDVRCIDIRAHFEIGDDTLTRRLSRIIALGAEYVGGRGRPARLIIPEATGDDTQEQLDLAAESAHKVPARDEFPHAGTSNGADSFSLNHAENGEVPASSRTTPSGNSETGDLQGKQRVQVPASLRDVPARARARATPQDGAAIDFGGEATTDEDEDLWADRLTGGEPEHVEEHA